MAQAWRNIASPCSADRCSEKRSTGLAFLSAFLKHPPTPDKLDAPHVLSLKPEQVEGVEARASLPVA
jgi:hypothetical protein